MISADDPFIKSQSDGLYARVLGEETQKLMQFGFTADLELNANRLAAHHMAEIASMAVWTKNFQQVEIDALKDENADLRKKRLPDGMPASKPVENHSGTWVWFVVVHLLAAWGLARIFV